MKRMGSIMGLLLCLCLALGSAQALNLSKKDAQQEKKLQYIKEALNNSVVVGDKAYKRDTYVTLKKGDKGDLVKAVQRKLIDFGYLVDSADGVFGTNTENAVSLFQNTASIPRTGTLDFDTLKALMSDSAPWYREEDFAASFSTYAKWNTKGKSDMTFQVQVNNDSRHRNIRTVGLFVRAKDGAGNVIGTSFTQECIVKIAPGKSAYVPAFTVPERKRVRSIDCAIAWVDYDDGVSIFAPGDPVYWTWNIDW